MAAAERRMRTFSGARVALPKLEGIGGGGVWRIEIDPQTGLARTPELVGVVIEHLRRDEVFIAVRVQLGIPLARELVRELNAANA